MTTGRITLVAVIAILGVSLAPAAPRAAHPHSAKPAAVDYVKELVDNYHDGSERMRFFAAAGVDIELSKTEFAAAMGKAGSFVRRYDRWQAVVVFDENSNGTLDWFEAEAYRMSLRRQVMSLFDKNKNRKIDGAEAAAANRWLARGVKPIARRQALVIVRGLPVRASADEDNKAPAVKDGAQDLPPGIAWQQTWREMEREFDKDGDGGLSYKERKELYKAYRERFRQRMLEQWDSDRNGQLSEREREHMAAELRKVAQQRQEAFAERRKEPISPTELARRKRAAAQREANRKIFAEAREQAAAEHEEHMKKWDTDGDGKISDDERDRLNKSKQGVVSEVERIKQEGRLAAHRQRSEQERWKRLSKWDTDGDGKLSAQEQRALHEEVMRIEAKLRRQALLPAGWVYRGGTEGEAKTEVEIRKPAPAAKAEKLPAMPASAPQGTPELPPVAEQRDKRPVGRREQPERLPRAGSRRRQSIAAWGGGEEGSSPHFVAAVAAGVGACAALVATVLLFTGQHHFRSALSRLLRRILGRR